MLTVETDANRTDADWEMWGARDPYFGVLTEARYRALTFASSDYIAFFESGRGHVESVLGNCRRNFGEDFRPRRVLDFGCGVGRVLLPFAQLCESAVGVDVSDSMLAEARRNSARFNASNVTLVRSDDALSEVHGRFDLVHSSIVLQHIENERGLDLVARLVDLVEPGGVVAIHVTYGRDYGENRYGRPVPHPLPPPPKLLRRLRKGLRGFLSLARTSLPKELPKTSEVNGDPMMMMHHYDLSRIAYILHKAGASGFHAEFTDHGGELGAMVFARVDAGVKADLVEADPDSTNLPRQNSGV